MRPEARAYELTTPTSSAGRNTEQPRRPLLERLEGLEGPCLVRLLGSPSRWICFASSLARLPTLTAVESTRRRSSTSLRLA